MDIEIGNTVLTEGVTPATTGSQYAPVSVTAVQYGKTVTISDRTQYQEAFDNLESASEQLAEKMRRIHDKAIQAGMNDGSNVIYAGTATSRATV